MKEPRYEHQLPDWEDKNSDFYKLMYYKSLVERMENMIERQDYEITSLQRRNIGLSHIFNDPNKQKLPWFKSVMLHMN